MVEAMPHGRRRRWSLRLELRLLDLASLRLLFWPRRSAVAMTAAKIAALRARGEALAGEIDALARQLGRGQAGDAFSMWRRWRAERTYSPLPPGISAGLRTADRERRWLDLDQVANSIALPAVGKDVPW